MNVPATRRRVLAGAAIAATGLVGWRVGAANNDDRKSTTRHQSRAPSYRLRGVNLSTQATHADIKALAATGANLARIMCPATPLRGLAPPYAIDDTSLTRLDDVIAQCQEHRLRVIIDPHAFPGMQSKYTCNPDDDLWWEPRFQDMAVELWDCIAERYKDAGDVIFGYDLLNEPAVPDVTATMGLGSWNALARRLAAAVRAHDARRHLVIEPAVGRDQYGFWCDRFASMKYMSPPPQDRVIVSPHMYAPHGFTMQGVEGVPAGPTYPGSVDGEPWDKRRLARHMLPARKYQQLHGVPILIGEFGVARRTDAAGLRYLRDNVDLYESWGWSWAYLTWRGYEAWDAEMTSDPTDTRRHDSTPRLDLLKRYFARNGGSPD